MITTAGKAGSFLNYSKNTGFLDNTHQVKMLALIILSRNIFQN